MINNLINLENINKLTDNDHKLLLSAIFVTLHYAEQRRSLCHRRVFNLTKVLLIKNINKAVIECSTKTFFPVTES